MYLRDSKVRFKGAVAFVLHNPAAPGSNFGFPRFLLDISVLTDSKNSTIRLNKLIEPIQYW